MEGGKPENLEEIFENPWKTKLLSRTVRCQVHETNPKRRALLLHLAISRTPLKCLLSVSNIINPSNNCGATVCCIRPSVITGKCSRNRRPPLNNAIVCCLKKRYKMPCSCLHGIKNSCKKTSHYSRVWHVCGTMKYSEYTSCRLLNIKWETYYRYQNLQHEVTA